MEPYLERFYTKEPSIDYENLVIVVDQLLCIEYSMQFCDTIVFRDEHVRIIEEKNLYCHTASIKAKGNSNWDALSMDDDAEFWIIFYDSKSLSKTITSSTFHESCLSFLEKFQTEVLQRNSSK